MILSINEEFNKDIERNLYKLLSNGMTFTGHTFNYTLSKLHMSLEIEGFSIDVDPDFVDYEEYNNISDSDFDDTTEPIGPFVCTKYSGTVRVAGDIGISSENGTPVFLVSVSSGPYSDNIYLLCQEYFQTDVNTIEELEKLLKLCNKKLLYIAKYIKTANWYKAINSISMDMVFDDSDINVSNSIYDYMQSVEETFGHLIPLK